MLAQKLRPDDIQPAQKITHVQRRIYMDHNGSTPTHPAAVTAMMPFLVSAFGNPSSGHWASDPAKSAVEKARASVARLIGAQPGEIVITSGATEANNLAIKGCLPKPLGNHIITSAIEHDAVLKTVRAVKLKGVRVTFVPVDDYGIVDPEAVRRAITEQTTLISIMLANNEIGTVQPVAEVADIAREYGITVHTDAAQAIGKIPVNIDSLGVDLLSIAGHKFGAPNGVGSLFIRKGTRLSPLLHGGGHEGGRRAGTESALLAAGLGAAAEQAAKKDNTRVRALRDYFWNFLSQTFGKKVILNGHPKNRVPNTLNVSFPGKIGAEILATMPHVAATTGSACHAGCIDMSHVLIAMGKSTENGLGTIRFSLGDGNTREEVDEVVASIAKAIA
ncbi:Cysteine desulfurase [Roseibium album]|nr:Cysteine desulfurase [Roseibium album]